MIQVQVPRYKTIQQFAHQTNASSLSKPLLDDLATRINSIRPELTPRSIKSSKTAPIDDEARVLAIEMHKNGVPFGNIDDMFQSVFRTKYCGHTYPTTQFSRETATRATVEMGIAIEYYIVELTSATKQIYLCTDGASTSRSDSFHAISTGGNIHNQNDKHWLFPLHISQSIGGSADDYLYSIITALARLNEKRRELNLPLTLNNIGH